MKNAMYDFNEIYRATRSAYMTVFPYGLRFNAIYIVKKMMEKYDIKGEITVVQGKYIFTLSESPARQQGVDLYGGRTAQMDAEDFIVNEDNLAALISDLNTMNEWLIDQGFVTKNSIASEKLVSTKRLVL